LRYLTLTLFKNTLIIFSMDNIPNGYRTYQYLLWLDTMNQKVNDPYFEGVPTPSNLLAHILKARSLEFDSYKPKDANIYKLRDNFCRTMMDKYIRKSGKTIKLHHDNSLVMRKGYYKRDRIESLLEITENGYERLAYLYMLNNRSHEILDSYDIPQDYYTAASIVTFRKLHMRLTSTTERVVRFHKDKLPKLPTPAQEKLNIEQRYCRKVANKFSDGEGPHL